MIVVMDGCSKGFYCTFDLSWPGIHIYSRRHSTTSPKSSHSSIFLDSVTKSGLCVKLETIVYLISGNFKAADEGTILKKFSENEMQCFEKLGNDSLHPFVPGYHGVVKKDGEAFLHMTDLLATFELANVMDCKMGVR